MRPDRLRCQVGQLSAARRLTLVWARARERAERSGVQALSAHVIDSLRAECRTASAPGLMFLKF